MDTSDRQHDGWSLRESGPTDAERTVLLLAGAMSPASFFDDLTAEPRLRELSLRLVAATLPGHAGTAPPADLTLEAYGRLAAKLARDLGCDAVVGHSLGANVAIEMAITGEYVGPLVLLSPSFSRQDESRFIRVMDRLAGVVGPLPFRVMLAMAGPALKEVKVTPARRAQLVQDLKKNDPRFLRRAIRSYLEYLDRHGSLAAALCESGAPAWVVFGDHDDVGLTVDERTILVNCPTVTMDVVADAGHLTLNEQPARVADIVIDAISPSPS